MHASNFNLPRYLTRINFTGQPGADIDTLRALMRAQLRAVPFENLDVQAGKIVSLVPEEIVDKVVGRNRGGYCYEVNGLFAMALEALGLPYQFVAARPMFYPVRRPKTHAALVVSVDGQQWLCDLGFGSYGIREPLCLDQLDLDVAQGEDTFRLGRDDKGNYLLQAKADGVWQNQYEFNLSPQEWIDFAPANYLNSTHPDAIFVQKYLVIMHTARGRKILVGDNFKTIEDGQVRETKIAGDAIPQLLRSEFGLVAD